MMPNTVSRATNYFFYSFAILTPGCEWCHVNCWMKPNGCYSQNIIWIYYIACNRMGASGLTEMYSY